MSHVVRGRLIFAFTKNVYFAKNCLVSNGDVKFRAALDGTLEMFYSMQTRYDGKRVFDVVGRAHNASLELLRVKVGQANAAAIAFGRFVNRLAKHLY